MWCPRLSSGRNRPAQLRTGSGWGPGTVLGARGQSRGSPRQGWPCVPTSPRSKSLLEQHFLPLGGRGGGRSRVAGQARKKTRTFCRIGLFPRPIRTQLGPCRAEGREAGPEFVLHSELSQLWSFSSRAQSSRCGWCLSFLKTPSMIEGPVLGDASPAGPCAGSGSPSQAGGRQVGQTHWGVMEAAASGPPHSLRREGIDRGHAHAGRKLGRC